MKCPNCDKYAMIPENAERNADAYGKPSIVLTECCDTLVRLRPVRSYELYPYDGANKADDWGREPKAKQARHQKG